MTTTAIQELDADGAPVVTVLREDVTALHPEYGFVSERRGLGLVVGLVLTLGGLFVGGTLFDTLLSPNEHVGRRAAYLSGACATLLVIGPWLVAWSLRRGPFVLVNLRSDIRKLAFRSAVSADEVAGFVFALKESTTWKSVLRAPKGE